MHAATIVGLIMSSLLIQSDSATAPANRADRSDDVKVCQVGYLPNESKFAMLTGTTSPSGDAVVRRAADGSAVLSVPVGEAFEDADSGDRVRAIDFS
jgi:hypothetical protein